MIRYILRHGWRVFTHPRIAWGGFVEGWDDMGLTFGDPWTSKSMAHDVGRTLRRRDA